jgi:hypothetical protein
MDGRNKFGHDENQFPFSLAFTFGCDLFETESEIANANWRTPGGCAFWIGFSTSLSSVAASMAAASRAMRQAGAILFSFVK